MNKIETLLAIAGVFIGWGLKTLADYVAARKIDNKTYNQSIFFLLRTWKYLIDYERGTEYFRSKKPDIDKFEPWRKILESKLVNNLKRKKDTTINAVQILAQVDPVLATRLDNSTKNLETSLSAQFSEVAESDPERYVKMLYNQDYIIDLSLSDFERTATTLAKRVSMIQHFRVKRYFYSINKGTAEYNEGMEKNSEMLDKVVNP